jgi:hypothetical protein
MCEETRHSVMFLWYSFPKMESSLRRGFTGTLTSQKFGLVNPCRPAVWLRTVRGAAHLFYTNQLLCWELASQIPWAEQILLLSSFCQCTNAILMTCFKFKDAWVGPSGYITVQNVPWNWIIGKQFMNIRDAKMTLCCRGMDSGVVSLWGGGGANS